MAMARSAGGLRRCRTERIGGPARRPENPGVSCAVNRSRRAWLAAAALGAAGGARAAAPQALQPGALAQFRVPWPAPLRRLAGRAEAARVAVATPPAFDAARPWPVLVVNATSDRGHASSRRLLALYREAAAAAGWVALAADPEPDVAPAEDVLSLRFALARIALAVVQPSWADADQAAVAFAGFSGGAKYAGALAALFAAEGRRVGGVFMSGVNEEPMVSAARRIGRFDDTLRAVPVFLQGGRGDRIATPQRHEALRDELRQAGLARVRLEFVDGGHEPDATWLQAALQWFAA
jgi:predicted esterase